MVAKTKAILEYLHSDISPFDIVGELGSEALGNCRLRRRREGGCA